MSSVVIAGDTSGTITLAAPAVSGTTTLTLPATTGTVALTASPTFTGQATIPTINLTGGQITFPATQSASADANTLDDYEEGTFSPTIIGTSTAGTVSYTIQVGAYLKIGRLVYISTYIVWTSGTGTGSLQFGNLPFTATSSPTIYQGLTMSGVTGLAGNTAGNVLYSRVNTNDNKLTIQSFGTGTTIVDGAYPYASSGTLLFGGCYIVAS